MFRAFNRFRLLDGVHVIVLRVPGSIIVVITGFPSNLEDTTKFSASKVFVKYVEVPFELSRTFVTRRDWLGVPDTSALF